MSCACLWPEGCVSANPRGNQGSEWETAGVQGRLKGQAGALLEELAREKCPSSTRREITPPHKTSRVSDVREAACGAAAHPA